MSDLPTPPHIRKALADLPTLNLPPDALPHARAALQLAADHYHATTQVARADKMQKQRDQAQDELERVSSDLLAARKELDKLHEAKREVNAQLNESARHIQHAADLHTGHYQSLVARFEKYFGELAAILTHQLSHPETKVKSARRVVATALAESTNRKWRFLAAKTMPPTDD